MKNKLSNKLRTAVFIGTMALGSVFGAYSAQPNLSVKKQEQVMPPIPIPGTNYKANDEITLALLYADAGVIEKREKIKTTHETRGLITEENLTTVPVENPALRDMSPLEFYDFNSQVLEGICKRIVPKGEKTVVYSEVKNLFSQLAKTKSYQYSGK